MLIVDFIKPLGELEISDRLVHLANSAEFQVGMLMGLIMAIITFLNVFFLIKQEEKYTWEQLNTRFKSLKEFLKLLLLNIIISLVSLLFAFGIIFQGIKEDGSGYGN